MSEDSLFPDLPRSLRRFEVTVTVPRPDDGQEVLRLAAAASAAEGVLSAFTSSHASLVMTVEAASRGDALDAGVKVARVLDGGDGRVSVTAEPAGAAV